MDKKSKNISNTELLRQSCEMCENYSVEHACEDREKCPIYMLYQRAEGKVRYKYVKDTWAKPPTPPIGII